MQLFEGAICEAKNGAQGKCERNPRYEQGSIPHTHPWRIKFEDGARWYYYYDGTGISLDSEYFIVRILNEDDRPSDMDKAVAYAKDAGMIAGEQPTLTPNDDRERWNGYFTAAIEGMKASESAGPGQFYSNKFLIENAIAIADKALDAFNERWPK